MTPTPLRALAAAALAAAAALVAAGPAAAAPQVVVAGEGGQAVAAADAPTSVQVSGTGFQSVPGGFGGVYVLFGWVDPASGDGWRPSAGGVSGAQYRYAVDVQGQENAGYQRFVAFPGSTTAVEANGGEVAEDGSWSTDLTIPGATITALDADGGTVEVDCRVVTCGVITIGAHGVANANNESFTPVTFDAPDAAAAPPSAEPSAGPAEAAAEPTAVAAPVDDDADAGGSGAAPWVVAGSAAAAAVGATVAGAAGARGARRRREAGVVTSGAPGATPGGAPDDQQH